MLFQGDGSQEAKAETDVVDKKVSWYPMTGAAVMLEEEEPSPWEEVGIPGGRMLLSIF